MIKSGIENPSKSEVIGRCGGDEKTQMTTQNRQKSNAKQKLKKNQLKEYVCPVNNFINNQTYEPPVTYLTLDVISSPCISD